MEEVFGALLTHLSKAFDCLDHELLTAKLNIYGFSFPALQLVNSYLSKRKQRTKIYNIYSTWLHIIFGILQGSILGSLFSVFLADLFFVVNDIILTSQFRYCPLVWMCHSHANNNKINRFHERCLQIVYMDKRSSFNELLEKDGSVSIHMGNIQILANVMYKLINNLLPAIVDRVFKLNSDIHYNLRQILQFSRSLLNW